MTQAKLKFDVSPGQVVAARALIERRGGVDRVSPRVAYVASLPLDEVQAEWSSQPIDEQRIHAAKLLIDMRGGEEFVEPHVVAIAHATPAAAARS